MFHGSVQFAKAPGEAKVGWLRRKISLAAAQERELVIDPQFFLQLSQSIPGIANVEILLKRGRANNELTRYRYDVLLQVGEAKPAEVRQEAEWHAGDTAIVDLVSRFKELRLPAVRILDVPNIRLARDLAVSRLVESADDQRLINDLRNRMAGFKSTGTDPEIFWQLLDPQVYDVRVGWSAYSPDGRFDVALVDRRQWSGRPPLQRPRTDWSGVTPALATDPLAAAFMQHLGLHLAEMLRTRLPEPQLPAAVLVVNQMPA